MVKYMTFNHQYAGSNPAGLMLPSCSRFTLKTLKIL